MLEILNRCEMKNAKQPLANTLLDCEQFILSLRTEDALVTYIGVEYAIVFLRAVCADFPQIPTPTIGEGPDGMIGISWGDGHDYINVEFFADGHGEFFHEEMSTHAVFDTSIQNGTPCAAVLAFLSRLA